jgi:hypothetical protein
MVVGTLVSALAGSVLLSGMDSVRASAEAGTTKANSTVSTGGAVKIPRSAGPHVFALVNTADSSNCSSNSFGVNVGSCITSGGSSTTSPFSGARVDWQQGAGEVKVSILDGLGDILAGTMSNRGSDSLAISSGSVSYWGATSNITTGTGKPAGQVDGPLRINVSFGSTAFTFKIDGYLNYGQSGGAVPTTTTLTQLPTASPGEQITYKAFVKPTNAKSATYGRFTFTFSGGVRQQDNCYHPLEDDSGRASCTVSYLDPGTFSVEAYFGGTADRQASSASVDQVIDNRPYATVQPSAVHFPFQYGKTSLARSVVLSWDGDLTVSKVSVEGSNDFRVTDENCTESKAPRPCTILVTVTASTGSPSGKLVIMDNASNSPQVVTLGL